MFFVAARMNRFKQIDILRALAVFLVLGRHITLCPSETSPFFHRVTEIWAQGGWIGVDLFFVLSGFLVSGLLFREHEKYQKLHIGHFLIRRGFKIYPPFWLLIGVTILMWIVLHKPIPLPALASELLFVQNYVRGMWNHTWSLAVEEHFYLLLAFGLFVLSKRRSARPFALIPAGFILVALLCLTLRILTGALLPYRHMTHLVPTHLRLDGLFFGVFLSYLSHFHPVKFVAAASRFRHLLLATGVGCLFPAFCLPLETPWISTFGFTLFYVGSGCLLVSALGFRAPESRLFRAVAYVGSHSYSIYLWHMPVAIWGSAALARLLSPNSNWYVDAAFYLVGSIAFGIAMAVFTEFPVLRIRDRFFPSRGTALSTDAMGRGINLSRVPSS